MDAMNGMRKYLKRLGESHPQVLARVLANREVASLDEVSPDDFFAVAEQMRAEAGLPNAFMLARKRGIALVAEANDADHNPVSTAHALNTMAVALYDQEDGRESLIDAVPEGASIAEAINAMGVAANTLRRMPK